jgi:putative ABC transport system permease protein
MVRDIRFGIRLLTRTPVFAAAALTILALGVGATTAVFTVVRGVLLQPLPYKDPGRLVLFRANLPGYPQYPLLTPAELSALRELTTVFEAAAPINQSQADLTAPDDMEAVTAAAVGDNFFPTLGVAPALGRIVTRQDASGAVGAVTISDELWRTHFHADPAIVGRTIEIDNEPAVVVGVMPRGFRLYLGPGVGVASRLDVLMPRGRGWDDDPARTTVTIARLRPGVTAGAAQAAVDAAIARVVSKNPAAYRAGAIRVSLTRLDRDVVSGVAAPLLALAAAVGFVLLVACANLTNLLLARGSARAREIAVRASIGASPSRIMRQLVAESLVVGVLGAAMGLLLANWGVAALLQLAPSTLPRLDTIRLDGSMAAFAAGLSLLCALAVSLIPARQAAKRDVSSTLKQSASAALGARTTRGMLVAAQLALSLVLLVGAGLMGRAFINMRLVPLGFDAHDALTMNVGLNGARFNGGTLAEARERRLVFYHELADALRLQPGVRQVGVGLPVPLSGPPLTQRVAADGASPELPADGAIALSGFLESLHVPFVAGRAFVREDDNRPVAIIDERLAAELWPGTAPQSAVGRRVLVKTAIGQQWDEVIGVVRHVQMRGLREADLPQIWMTYGTRSYSALSLVIRAAQPATLVESVRQTVQRLGAGRPVHDIRLLEEYVNDASADTRFAVSVLGGFAVIAVVLSALGVYGVVSYATSRRTKEIALRIALGAGPQRVVRLLIGDAIMWMTVGLAAGVAGAMVLTRYLQSLLFEVGATDPVTFTLVPAVLTGVALAATVIPALRAVRIDPMAALKSE